MVSTVRVFEEIVCEEIMSEGSTFSRPGMERSSSSVMPPLLSSPPPLLANCGGGGGV